MGFQKNAYFESRISRIYFTLCVLYLNGISKWNKIYIYFSSLLSELSESKLIFKLNPYYKTDNNNASLRSFFRKFNKWIHFWKAISLYNALVLTDWTVLSSGILWNIITINVFQISFMKIESFKMCIYFLFDLLVIGARFLSVKFWTKWFLV